MFSINFYPTPLSSPNNQDNSFSSYFGASYPSNTTNSDKIIDFSQKIVEFLYWDQKTSSPRSPSQGSPSKLAAERTQKIQSLNQEKNSLLRNLEKELELAACVERLAKKAPLPNVSTISFAKLSHEVQTAVNKTVDILLEAEQTKKNITTTLHHTKNTHQTVTINPLTEKYFNRCVENSLLFSDNLENLENSLKKLPKQTERALTPIITSTS
ncbi:MAG: hypothetical protein V4489_00350, partial [Chlamydiota bacterium]